MRILNTRETALVNSDLGPLEKFFKINGLESEQYLKKYNTNLKILAESGNVLKGAHGITHKNGEQISIGLHEGILENEHLRPRTLYHELGHALMGITYLSKEKQDAVFNKIVNTIKANENILSENATVYLEGLRLLEEYLVEKFSFCMLENAKRMPIPQKRYGLSNPSICGNYTYDATFDTNYAIFESLGDKLITKTFGSSNKAIRAGLSENFFTSFFEKYNNVEIMKILENLGHIKLAIYARGGQNNYVYDPNEINKRLVETNSMIDAIQPEILNQISATARQTMERKPGEISTAVREKKGLFSRIINKINDLGEK